MFPEEAGYKEVAVQEMEVIAAEEDVPEMRLPTYDDMGFPDYGLDRFWCDIQYYLCISADNHSFNK